MPTSTHSMIRVASIFFPSTRWLGGLSYLKNLYTAVYALPDRKIEFFLFIGRKDSYERLSDIAPFVQVEKTSYFDQQSGVKGFFRKIYHNVIKKTLKIDYIDYLFQKHDIAVCMHSWRYNTAHLYKTVNWIPDFQHLHLPQYFSKEEIEYRNKKYFETIQHSDCIIVNSRSVFNDLKSFAPEYTQKVRVLPFVATIDERVYKGLTDYRSIRDMPDKYFFVPNQFWQHKNHLTVLKAAQLLKRKGVSVAIVFAGNTQDFRKSDFIQHIEKKIQQYRLGNQVKILGVISHYEVLLFMRNSLSVINPSFFEGWSTSVEEVKSLGKNSILSDIPVHREQNPPECEYFDPHDAWDLARRMEKKWKTGNGGPDYALEKQAKAIYKKRVLAFGRAYQKILLESAEESDQRTGRNVHER